MPHSIASLGDKAVVAHASKLLLIDRHTIIAQFEVATGHIDNLVVSPDQTKILGVNHFDKSVIVFNTELKEKTRFAFPKRPSSLAFKSDTQVLVADKFGDVYDLDLEGTVTDEKGEFNLSPVLGHVSMLLKVIVADEKILTADRDEHIKVSTLSRPFNIEGFCFGHSHYVSDLCVVENSVFSAGGDSFIAKWSLQTFEEIGRLDLAAIFPDMAEFNVLRISNYDDNHIIAIIQESPVILVINSESLSVVQQYALPDKATDVSVGTNGLVWVALKESVLITDLKTTDAFPEAFGDSEVRVLMQHEMRKRAEH